MDVRCQFVGVKRTASNHSAIEFGVGNENLGGG